MSWDDESGLELSRALDQELESIFREVEETARRAGFVDSAAFPAPTETPAAPGEGRAAPAPENVEAAPAVAEIIEAPVSGATPSVASIPRAPETGPPLSAFAGLDQAAFSELISKAVEEGVLRAFKKLSLD